MEALNDLHEAISRGDAQKVLEMTGALLQAGMTPEKVLNVGLIEALEKVGSAFASGELFLPRPAWSPGGPFSSAPSRATSTTSERTSLP
jgi:methanogenic corrinoid protein MtbC1